MQESTFIDIFKEAAKQICGKNFIVESKTNLFYELYLNGSLDFSIKDTKNPKRGYSAFQVDICVYEQLNDLLFSRIAIEFKTKITSHDIITYSAKAGKHKVIYPCLRYGLISSEIDSIPSKFFIHNEHIDFFVAGKKYKSELLSSFIEKLINKEIQVSKTLESIYLQDNKFDYYRADIQMSNFSEIKF